jgi:hypothetical protein
VRAAMRNDAGFVDVKLVGGGNVAMNVDDHMTAGLYRIHDCAKSRSIY